MLTRGLSVLLSLTALSTCVVFCEARCPGNAETMRYHPLSHLQIAIPVAINGAGPYEFLVDTGAQITIIESSLKAEVHLHAEGKIGLVSGVRRAEVEVVGTNLIEVGRHAVRQAMVAVQSLGQIQVENPKVRGILGEDFLTHFDVLID